MAHLARIWRHPIKAHGREALQAVRLSPGQTLPGDRAWAVSREGANVDGSAWVSCGHFSRAAKNPALQAITARLDDETGRISLSHPERPDISFDPATEGAAFIAWAAPLSRGDAPRPQRLLRAAARGMTDTPFASVSILNAASHRAVAQRLGREISPGRWRGNLLLEGLAPWEEFEWIGRRLKIGEAVLRIEERIGRCQATSASTRTGRRDTDMLRLLSEGWGHTDFGVYAVVEEGGALAVGDPAELLG